MMSKEAKKNYVEQMKKSCNQRICYSAQYQGLNVNELDTEKELREFYSRLQK